MAVPSKSGLAVSIAIALSYYRISISNKKFHKKTPSLNFKEEVFLGNIRETM
jgi:hypothetical protein